MARANDAALGNQHGKITEVISDMLDQANDIKEKQAAVAVGIAWMKHNSIYGDAEKDQALKDLNDKLKERRKRSVPTMEELRASADEILNGIKLN